MKILKTNVEYYATMGLTRNQAMQRQPFNATILLQLLKFFVCFILCGGYLIFEASDSKEYAVSIYFTSTCIVLGINFVNIARNIEYFFNFVDGSTKCLKESEYGCRTIYNLSH